MQDAVGHGIEAGFHSRRSRHLLKGRQKGGRSLFIALRVHPHCKGNQRTQGGYKGGHSIAADWLYLVSP